MSNSTEIYQFADGQAQLSVTVDQDTVWLSLDQMVQLFDRDKSVISRHLRNLFAEGELERSSVVAKNATTATDGKTYQVDYCDLDVIISVGYRVKSRRGIDSEQTVRLPSRTLSNQQLVNPEGEAVLSVISDYALNWSLLQGYESLPKLNAPNPDTEKAA